MTNNHKFQNLLLVLLTTCFANYLFCRPPGQLVSSIKLILVILSVSVHQLLVEVLVHREIYPFLKIAFHPQNASSMTLC